MRTLERVAGRHFDVWRIPGRFTKNPDLVRLPSGKMLLVFCDVEKHWTEEISRITLLESTDGGKTWGNARVIAQADRRKGEERWVTPRLSLLRDGRLAVICDHDDYSHYHEDQPPGIWIWFSRDEGRTWSAPRLTEVPGIEPDRIVELNDGTLLMAACMVFGETQKEGMFVLRSSDGGASWKERSIIARDSVNNHTEGAIVVLRNGLLACVMRNENHNGYPSYVALSEDRGRTWSKARPLPFSGDRPYAKQLSGGEVLVTYRNQCGNRGTHAWMGDLTRDHGHQICATHYEDRVSLNSEALHIESRAGGTTRYILLPPESYRSEVIMEALVRVSGPPDQPVAAMEPSRMGIGIAFCSNAVWLSNERRAPGRPVIDNLHRCDMTEFRRVVLRIRRGLAAVDVDGRTVMYAVLRDEMPLRETWFGRAGMGESWWRSFSYRVRNATEPAHASTWQAQDGRHPDQYQLDHILEVHANPPGEGHRPDNGYSSWLELPDGRIYFVDYSNRGDPPPGSHLYGAYLSPSDFSGPCGA
jgi:hypothetical protein